MEIKIIFGVVATVLSALLYRFGGWGKPFNTKWRDLGIPSVCLSYLWFIAHSSLQGAFLLKIGLFLVAFGLMFGACTTYWDFLYCNGGKDNFYMHGFMIGIALLPLAFLGLPWWLILIRAIILAGFMGWLNWAANKFKWKYSDWIEELGRGAIIVLTFPIFMVA